MCDQADRFASGRHLSAWLGMTPSEYRSGERRRLGRISCKGNVYVRTLLIPGARATLLAAKRCKARTPERLTQLQSWALQTAERIGHNKAAVALANKLVRICWRCGAMNDGSTVTSTAQSPPDGGIKQ